ncbi:MAG: hypothetical protein RIA10_12115 [Amphiplicatus sp.]
MSHDDYPIGVQTEHLRPSPMRRPMNVAAVLILAGFLGAALTGAFGGGAQRRSETESAAARFAVEAPAIHRNGKFFETRFIVEARADIGEAVIAVDETLWRDMTLNTLTPAPEKESFADGAFRFSFGPLKTGDTLVFKTDLQINPSLAGENSGSVALYDGNRRLASLDLAMQARP